MKNQTPNAHSFSSKWGLELEGRGFTSVPNCLLTCQAKLNITSSELNVLFQILQFKFDKRAPFPSMQTIAKRSGMSVNTVRRNIRALETKKMLQRVARNGDSNMYDFKPLMEQILSHFCPMGIQKQTPQQPNLDGLPYPILDNKEDNKIIQSNKTKRPFFTKID